MNIWTQNRECFLFWQGEIYFALIACIMMIPLCSNGGKCVFSPHTYANERKMHFLPLECIGCLFDNLHWDSHILYLRVFGDSCLHVLAESSQEINLDSDINPMVLIPGKYDQGSAAYSSCKYRLYFRVTVLKITS